MATTSLVPARAPQLTSRYTEVRAATCALAARLTPEDQLLQSMPDASPTKWHLAHTTWFFETFVLGPFSPGYRPFHPAFAVLFNSYYQGVGPQHPRGARGLLSRPTLEEVHAYRAHVDAAVARLLQATERPELGPLITLGLHHEQQHQELLLTDAHHALAQNPLRPAYRLRAGGPPRSAEAPPVRWIPYPEQMAHIGFAGDGFAFDNERPRHRAWLEGFALANRLVTAGEYLEFVRDGGYARPELWLSDGWATVVAQGWIAPLYWEEVDGVWTDFTLGGMRPVDASAPVAHVSFYEADAFARWADARLPTEAEWELSAAKLAVEGNFVEEGNLTPVRLAEGERPGEPAQMFGDVWEWTASPYVGYPRYRAPEGAIGEYNGKFMCNQLVLRGGSCLTPRSHVRATYRNFFPPATRWQMSGIRLARWA